MANRFKVEAAENLKAFEDMERVAVKFAMENERLREKLKLNGKEKEKKEKE